VWQRANVVHVAPQRPVIVSDQGGPTWGVFALGLASGAVIVFVAAVAVILIARAGMRPISFARPAPLKLKP
jgi:hypothetical protein